MNTPPERQYELDWLRVLAVLLLIYFHTAAIFYRGDLGEFYVTNSASSPALNIFIRVVHQWHMPLFSSWLGQVLDRQQPLLISAAILCMSVLLGLWMTNTVPVRAYSLAYMSYQALRGLNSWCWVAALVSLARSHLNFDHPLLRYANEASYPVYLLHQTIVVALGFYVVQWQVGITLKFVVISTGILIGTMGLYELVRRFNPLRICVGLKPFLTASAYPVPNQE